MKNNIVLGIMMFVSCFVYAQNNDLIVTIEGDYFACNILEVNDSEVILTMKYDGRKNVKTTIRHERIVEYKYDVILKDRDIFVRVYDMQGNKIEKGKIWLISDESLHLCRNDETKIIPVTNIGTIKTKRSWGNNILMGSVIGAAGCAILGAATADPDAWIFDYTPAEGAAIGAMAGGFYGSLAGGITIPFKNSKFYIIQGDASKLKEFKEEITRKPKANNF